MHRHGCACIVVHPKAKTPLAKHLPVLVFAKLKKHAVTARSQTMTAPCRQHESTTSLATVLCARSARSLCPREGLVFVLACTIFGKIKPSLRSTPQCMHPRTRESSGKRSAAAAGPAAELHSRRPGPQRAESKRFSLTMFFCSWPWNCERALAS